MKIALYKWAGFETVNEATEYREHDVGSIRTSEIIEVDFPSLPLEITIPAELAQLDVMEKELTAKHLTALDAIQTTRKDLLALAPPSAVPEAS